jgi:hypothetical protein
MKEKIKCRIFKKSVFWADVIFFFPTNLEFNDIKNNQKTSILLKKDYIGIFGFDPIYLSLIDKSEINGIEYYYSYHIPEKDLKKTDKLKL